MERGTSSLRVLWRRQLVLYLCVLLTSALAFAYHARVGQRYEPYVLLRSGQGIEARANSSRVPIGESIDLQSRMESLSRIAKIDHVLEEAARNTGYDLLLPKKKETEQPSALQSFLDEVWDSARAWVLSWTPGTVSPADTDTAKVEKSEDERLRNAVLGLRDDIVAKQEGRSDLLRITFRHKDPEVAARFLDELSNALVAIHTAGGLTPGAQEFFDQQTKRFEAEAEKAAADLKDFSVQAAIYAVDDQRQLLLRRANDLSTSMATTRGVIEDRKGQKQAVVAQLEVLKPVTQSRTVTRVVRTLSGADLQRVPESAREQTELQETPPLLLVKVYQDNMAALMKVDAELNGAAQLLEQLGTELNQVNKELALLSAKEAEYGRLKRDFTTASTAAAHYATRMTEEQINAEVAKKSQLSSLRVVQTALPPSDPVFPKASHLIGLALGAGVLLGFAIIFGPGLAAASMRTHRLPEYYISGDQHISGDQPVSLLLARQRKDGPKELQVG